MKRANLEGDLGEEERNSLGLISLEFPIIDDDDDVLGVVEVEVASDAGAVVVLHWSLGLSGKVCCCGGGGVVVPHLGVEVLERKRGVD